jgi:hypothetical protein
MEIKLHNEELHNLSYFYVIITTIKTERVNATGISPRMTTYLCKTEDKKRNTRECHYMSSLF